jgi:hypothetical protein
MDYIKFFTTDNQSGWKTKESTLKSKEPKVYNELTTFINNNSELNELPFKQKVWHFINNIEHIPSCGHCNAMVSFKTTLIKGYSKFCSNQCFNDYQKTQVGSDYVKSKIYDKHGVTSTNKLESVKAKKVETYIKKYGVDNPMKNEEIKIKQLKTIKENHGVSNPMHSDEIKNKQIKTINNQYGVDNVFQSEIIKSKIKERNQTNLGVDYPTQSQTIKDKITENANTKLLAKYPFIKEITKHDIIGHCDKCESDFIIPRILLNERYREGYELCTNCSKIGTKSTSNHEKELQTYLTNINIPFEQQNRTILDGKELDAYIPSKNIAIEVDGLYWHSEIRGKHINYHLDKTKMCESKGIQLIHIFEDEWVFKNDIVKSRINNLLGLTPNKIYGRKCDIRIVNTKDKGEFLDNNHIQGRVGSSVNLGLYHNNELVSLMTFGQGRIAMGGDSKHYELVRFCNKLDTSVIGGASKLLKYFIKTYEPNEIISYADRRWSNGGLYDTLGFTKIRVNKPNYWYVIGKERKHRFNFRKDKLVREGFDADKSEHQIMLERKIYRIYDCGTICYTLKPNHIDWA